MQAWDTIILPAVV